MEYGKTIQIIKDLVDFGITLKKDENIEEKFDEYQKRIQATLSALINKAEIVHTQQKIGSILALKLKKLTILNRIMLFKFRADYLDNWRGRGRYYYYIDEVNLTLTSIIQSMVVDEIE